MKFGAVFVYEFCWVRFTGSACSLEKTECLWKGGGAVSDSAPGQFRVIHVTPTFWTIGAHEFCSYGWVIETIQISDTPQFGAQQIAEWQFASVHFCLVVTSLFLSNSCKFPPHMNLICPSFIFHHLIWGDLDGNFENLNQNLDKKW